MKYTYKRCMHILDSTIDYSPYFRFDDKGGITLFQSMLGGDSGEEYEQIHLTNQQWINLTNHLINALIENGEKEKLIYDN